MDKVLKVILIGAGKLQIMRNKWETYVPILWLR